MTRQWILNSLAETFHPYQLLLVSLSLREVEELLAERGVTVSYEAIRN